MKLSAQQDVFGEHFLITRSSKFQIHADVKALTQAHEFSKYIVTEINKWQTDSKKKVKSKIGKAKAALT